MTDEVLAVDDVDIVAQLNGLEADDMGNAQAVYRVAGGRVRHTVENGWFVWNGVFWENNEHAVRKIVSDVLAQRHKLAGRGEPVHDLKSNRENISGAMWMLETLVKTDMQWFDRLDDKLPAPNGVVDLRTGELLPHDKDYGFTFTTTVDYNVYADTEPFEDLIYQNIDTGKLWAVEAFQRWLGYMLTGSTQEEKFLYLWGPGGSGKGTVLDTVRSVLPQPIQQVRNFSTFTRKRNEDTNHFDLAKLERARMVIAEESDRRVELNAPTVKSITGSTLHAAYKGKDGFDFPPKFKCVLISNWEVNADVDDSALWNRVIVAHFPHERRETEEEVMSLKAHFQEIDIKEGVLRFMVLGAVMWYEQGLSVPKQWRDAKANQRKELDMVDAWLEENTARVVDKDGIIVNDVLVPAAKVISNYTNWCKLNSVSPKQAKAFKQAMERKGIENRRTESARVYCGLALTKEYE